MKRSLLLEIENILIIFSNPNNFFLKMDLLRCAIRAHENRLLFLLDPKSLRIFVWEMLMNILGNLLIIYLK